MIDTLPRGDPRQTSGMKSEIGEEKMTREKKEQAKELVNNANRLWGDVNYVDTLIGDYGPTFPLAQRRQRLCEEIDLISAQVADIVLGFGHPYNCDQSILSEYVVPMPHKLHRWFWQEEEDDDVQI